MELEKGKSYTANDIEDYGCILGKHTAVVTFYRKADKVFIFDKNCDNNNTYKLLTIVEDKVDFKR